VSFHFPAPELALYVGHISDDVAEFNIDSPCCFSDDGTPEVLTVLVGTLPGWEFTCTEAPGRCPVWDEMRLVRDLCWESEDCVMQLHPPASRYINESPFALWQWRPVDCEIPQPPLWRERDRALQQAINNHYVEPLA